MSSVFLHVFAAAAAAAAAVVPFETQKSLTACSSSSSAMTDIQAKFQAEAAEFKALQKELQKVGALCCLF